MKEKKRTITILTIVCALIAFLSGYSRSLLALYLAHKKFNIDGDAVAVGIIGGADGPTAIYISSNFSTLWITIIFSLLTILGITYLVISKYKKNHV